MNVQAIEISFGAPIAFDGDRQRRLLDLLDEFCAAYEAEHPDRVMWTAGVGQKMLTNPFMVDDEHPMEFDDSVFSVECFERERFEGDRP